MHQHNNEVGVYDNVILLSHFTNYIQHRELWIKWGYPYIYNYLVYPMHSLFHLWIKWGYLWIKWGYPGATYTIILLYPMHSLFYLF